MNWMASIFLVIVLGGCYPNFQQPLTPLSVNSYDPCLSGAWLLGAIDNEDEDDLILHFGRGDGGEFELVSTSLKQSGRLEVETIFGHVSKTRAGNFLNFKETKDDKTFYYVLGFSLLDDQLLLRPLNTSIFSEALKSGRLKGDEETAMIINSPAEVISFFEEAGTGLFTDEMSFSRLSKKLC